MVTALAPITHGRAIVVVDDEDRANEGDLVLAAQLVTTELVTYMMNECRGLICVPMTARGADLEASTEVDLDVTGGDSGKALVSGQFLADIIKPSPQRPSTSRATARQLAGRPGTRSQTAAPGAAG